MYDWSFGEYIVQVWFLVTHVSFNVCYNMNACCCIHLVVQNLGFCARPHTPDALVVVQIKNKEEFLCRNLVPKVAQRPSQLKHGRY